MRKKHHERHEHILEFYDRKDKVLFIDYSDTSSAGEESSYLGRYTQTKGELTVVFDDKSKEPITFKYNDKLKALLYKHDGIIEVMCDVD